MRRTPWIGAMVLLGFLAMAVNPVVAQNDKSTSSRLAKLEQDVAGLLTQIGSLQGRVATLESTVVTLQERLLSAENRIAALEAGQSGGKPAAVIWSGGSSQHGFGVTGWIRYLTDREDFNTAAD